MLNDGSGQRKTGYDCCAGHLKDEGRSTNNRHYRQSPSFPRLPAQSGHFENRIYIFVTNQPSVHTKPMNPLIHLGPIHVKKYRKIQKIGPSKNKPPGGLYSENSPQRQSKTKQKR